MDQVLRALPAPYVVAGDGDARLVVGPTGAFVLLPTLGRALDLTETAARVRTLAANTRTALCDYLTWVPFLDPLLVGLGRAERLPDITVAPVDLLGVALTEGPRVIDRGSLSAIHHALHEGDLGPWVIAATEGTARIDLCDPFPAASSSTIRRAG